MYWPISFFIFSYFSLFLLKAVTAELHTLRGFTLPISDYSSVTIVEQPNNARSVFKKTIVISSTSNQFKFQVNLQLNTNLFAKDYFFYNPSLSSKDNSLPQQNYYYHGDVEHYPSSFVAISNCRGYHGMIILNEDTKKFSLHTLKDGQTFVLLKEKTFSRQNGFPDSPKFTSKYFYHFKVPHSQTPVSTSHAPLLASHSTTNPLTANTQNKHHDPSHQSTNQNLMDPSPKHHDSHPSLAQPQHPPFSSHVPQKPKSPPPHDYPTNAINNVNKLPFNPSKDVTHNHVPSSFNSNPGHIVNSRPLKQNPQTYHNYPQYPQYFNYDQSYSSNPSTVSTFYHPKQSSPPIYSQNPTTGARPRGRASFTNPFLPFKTSSTPFLGQFLSGISDFAQNSWNQFSRAFFQKPTVPFFSSYPRQPRWGSTPSRPPTHYQTHRLWKRHVEIHKPQNRRFHSSSNKSPPFNLTKRNAFEPYPTFYPTTNYYKMFIGLNLEIELLDSKLGEHLIVDYMNLAQYYFQHYSFQGYQIQLGGAHVLPLRAISSLTQVGREEKFLEEWRAYGLRHSFLSHSDLAFLFTVDHRDVYPKGDEEINFTTGMGYVGSCHPANFFSFGTIHSYEPHNLYAHLFTFIHELGHNVGIGNALKNSTTYEDGSVMSTFGGMRWKWKPYSAESLRSLKCRPGTFHP